MDNNNYKMLFFWNNGKFQTKNEMCKQQKWQKLKKKKKLNYCTSGRFLKKRNNQEKQTNIFKI
jgi:hypothetical protein